GGGTATKPDTGDATIYKVAAGDNLSKIAAKYGTTVDALAEINAIKNKNLIRVGQVLMLQDTPQADRKSTRLNSSHVSISYAVSARELLSIPTRRSADLRRRDRDKAGHRRRHHLQGSGRGQPLQDRGQVRHHRGRPGGDQRHQKQEPEPRGPGAYAPGYAPGRSEEHTSELQSRFDIVCRLRP